MSKECGDRKKGSAWRIYSKPKARGVCDGTENSIGQCAAAPVDVVVVVVGVVVVVFAAVGTARLGWE